MTNNQSQTIRQIRPASTTDVLPRGPHVGVQRYAPACRADSSRRSSPAEAEAHSEGGPCHAETPAVSELLAEPAVHNPPSDHQLSTNNHRPTAPRKVSRNGKIARLPYPIRDMVNRMLRNNIPHSKIVGALDEHGITVTQRNVSNWKTRGGYREWCAQQDGALQTHLLQDNLLEHLRTTDASQLSEVGLQLAATQLSQFFLKPDVREQLIAEPEKFSPAINLLCKLNRQLHRLQKYRDDSARELGPRHNPERVKRELEKDLEGTRHVYSAEKLGQTIHEYDISHRNFIPKNPRAYLSLDDSEPESVSPPADPLRTLSNLASLLKKDASP